MWWIFALLSAVASLGRNIVMKDLGHKLDEYSNVLGRFIFILPFAFLVTFIVGIPNVTPVYWFYSCLAGIFVAVSTMFLSKALKNTDISLVIALWKLNVIFLLILEIIFLKAHINSLGILGIIITFIGIYLLNIKQARVSIWKPFMLLMEDKGMRYGLLSAIFLAPAFLFFKITVNLSDPYFPAFTNYIFATLFTFPAVFKLSRNSFDSYQKHWKSFVWMGFFAFLTTVLGTIAYKASFATYVEAVKQSEVLFALIAGLIFFKEHKRVKEIWLGCCVIIIGIFIIILSN